MKLNWIFKRLFRRSDNAGRIAEAADGGQLDDGCGVHRFAAEREQAVSACRRVGLLASTLQAQRGRASDCGARDKVRELIGIAKGFRPEGKYFYGDGVVSVTDVGEHGDNVLLGDDGRVYFIDPLIRLNRSAEDVIEWLTGFNPAKDGELTKG